MNQSPFIISAAGGNITAIQVIDSPLTRGEYEHLGRQIMLDAEKLGAEQCGFLVTSTNHFEMAGGEFCGNAARAAAVLFSSLSGKTDVLFTMSGFTGTVKGNVISDGGGRSAVSCFFPNLPLNTRDLYLEDGRRARVVDLGGIVHVVVEGIFPVDAAEYSKQHVAIRNELGLNEREAVGVIWFEERGKDVVRIDPVVWVKAVDTFFYESSCGSGSIATAWVTNAQSVIQPTGKSILVKFAKEGVTLSSQMEVVHEND